MGINISNTSFATINGLADRFLSYLTSCGIVLHPASVLQKAIEDVRKAQMAYEQRARSENLDAISTLGRVAGCWYLIESVLNSVGTPFENFMKKQLSVLASGNPLPLTPGEQSNERDRAFELTIACTCSRFAREVTFQEPDVLVEYAGITWGLACKAAYGNTRTLVGQINKGMKQIKKSSADIGIVVVQCTNIFPHKEMIPVLDEKTGDVASFREPNDAITHFQRLLSSVVAQINQERAEKTRINPERVSPEKAPAILFVAQTIVIIKGIVTVIGNCEQTPRRKQGPEFDFCREFNYALQKFSVH